MNLKGKKIALFGLGDQVLYPENFVDGLSIISHELENRGAHVNPGPKVSGESVRSRWVGGIIGLNRAIGNSMSARGCWLAPDDVPRRAAFQTGGVVGT